MEFFQLLEPPEPSFPPPPPPSAPATDHSGAGDWNVQQSAGDDWNARQSAAAGDWNNDAWNSHATDSWGDQAPAPSYTNHNNAGLNNQGFQGGGMQQQASEEGWDDDWDDDNEDNSSNSTTNTSQVKPMMIRGWIDLMIKVDLVPLGAAQNLLTECNVQNATLYICKGVFKL